MGTANDGRGRVLARQRHHEGSGALPLAGPHQVQLVRPCAAPPRSVRPLVRNGVDQKWVDQKRVN